jgi:DNA-directed RNA polymerase
MIELDSGVVLPLPKRAKGFSRPSDITDYRWKTMKPELWQRAYTHCLYSLPIHFELPLHSVVPKLAKKMMEASDPFNVALRFMGEMELAGFITLERGMDERIVMPTQKFLDLVLDCERAPESAIVYPVLAGEELPNIPIRGGVSDAMNKHVASIASDMAGEEFEINEFMLDIIKKYPPTFDKTSSAFMYKRSMSAAKQYLGEKFKFPYFLDSRGRLYVTTTCGFSPQGADHEKALLVPTYKEKLTPSGFHALLEAANGYSEKSWSEHDMVRHILNTELYIDEIFEADKPYSYLACAKLVSDYMFDPDTPVPAFIPLDGRCSGLQHWSAVIRSGAITRHLGMDEDEADLDIYEKVADDWKAILPPEEKQFATRKAAKVPVMTWGYNATMMTSMEHMAKLFGAKQKWDMKSKSFINTSEGLARGVTSRLGVDLYRQLQQTLGPLQAAVSWVSDCATVISKQGNVEIRWPTPDGFTCLQRKVKGERLVLKCTLSSGDELYLEILDFSKEVPNTAKHRSAIAPNIIHSLDATHLRMVARRLKELGLPMIFIHDSFATHCQYRSILYDIIVETFIELYSREYLAELKSYWESMYGVELDNPPALGDWKPDSLQGLKRFFL